MKCLEEKAARLANAFEGRLSAEIGELALARQKVAEGHSAEGNETLRYIAHRISGSARLFGCEGLVKPARVLEALIEQGADTDEIFDAVRDLTASMKTAIANKDVRLDWLAAKAGY